MKKEETNINSRKHSVTVQRASRSLYLMPHTLYLNFIFYILYLILGSSCHYPRPDLEDGKLGAKTRDSLAYLYERHYTWEHESGSAGRFGDDSLPACKGLL